MTEFPSYCQQNCHVVMQVAEFYRGITAMNLSDQLKRELGKPMAAHLGIKAGLYTGLTLTHQAAVFIEDDECGQQIACLQVGKSTVHSLISDLRLVSRLNHGASGRGVHHRRRVRPADCLPAGAETYLQTT